MWKFSVPVKENRRKVLSVLTRECEFSPAFSLLPREREFSPALIGEKERNEKFRLSW
jgi:hypothetical protein